jgi:uncharacterized protein YacL
MFDTKEELLEGEKQVKKLLEMSKYNQKWLYYLIIGSFGSLIILNFIIPNNYLVKIKPSYDMKNGFIGLVLVVFGAFLLTKIIMYEETEFLGWFIIVILCLILLYFGLPLYLGFRW